MLSNVTKTLTRIGCVAVSLGGLAWVFHRVNAPLLLHALLQAKPLWIAGALGVFGLAFLAAAARWHQVLRISGCQVHALATGRTVLIGHFFNTILFGPTGGDIAKSAFYSDLYGLPTSQVLASCVTDRFLGGLGFFVFIACTPGFALYSSRWSERLNRALTLPRVALWGTIAIVIVLLFRRLHRRMPFAAAFDRMLLALAKNGRELMRNPRFTLRAVALSLASHICISSVFLCSLEAVTHAQFSARALFWVFPVMALITSAPVTFAGTGLREGAALFFLGMYGIPETDAVAASLLVFLTYLSWAIVGAILFWRAEAIRMRRGDSPLPNSISVVIPTLNEAAGLPATIEHIRQVPEICEMIVVDGGSSDETAQIAERLGCKVLAGPRSRGGQMRRGALQAVGDVVLLLHADTWVAPDCGGAVLRCLRDPSVVGGGFWKVFREKSWLMAGSRLRCALRLLIFRRVLGDQGTFVRRATLDAIGGVPDTPLMEEFELCARLRAKGTLVLAGATVSTSARRFFERGILRTYWRMARVTLGYYRGARAQDLERLYEKK